MATLTGAQIVSLYPELQQIESLAPPTPKGRYVIGRWADKVAPLFEALHKEEQQIIQRCAVKDEHGKIAFRVNGTRGSYDIIEGLREEHDRDKQALWEKEYTVEGVRMLLHAELGACPITAKQERILIACKVLDDVEPE